MNFSSFFVLLLGLFFSYILAKKLFAIILSPYFVCKLPECLGIINFDLDSNNTKSFCVYCASEDSLNEPFNMFHWESRGILSFDEHNIYYAGSKYRSPMLRSPGFNEKKKSHVKLKFDKQKIKISYVPKSYWRDGGLSWICLELDEVPFYFTTGNSRISILDLHPKEEATSGLYMMVSEL